MRCGARPMVAMGHGKDEGCTYRAGIITSMEVDAELKSRGRGRGLQVLGWSRSSCFSLFFMFDMSANCRRQAKGSSGVPNTIALSTQIPARNDLSTIGCAPNEVRLGISLV